MKEIITSVALLTASFLITAQAKPLPVQPQMTAEYAEQLAKKASDNCTKQNIYASISVVNQQGSLMYFLRAKNSGPHTVKTSFRKAYTAASLQAPTSALTGFVDMPNSSQLGKMTDDILLLPGGAPVRYEGNLIGAIGLSGGPDPFTEEKCATDAITAMK